MSTAVAKREPAEVVEQQDSQVEAIKRILSQQTPPTEIRVRVGRGGLKLKYTDGAYVIRTLNAAFGWDWDFVADSEELLTNNGKPFEVKVRGSLTVRLGGRTITKTQYGCQPIEMLKNGEAPVSIGDAYKGAATDAMKKCASLLGIALDLYDSDYKAEKYAEPHETLPEHPVKLEGAQPKDDELKTPEGRTPVVLWPQHKKYAPVFGKCKALKWRHVDLAGEIQRRFKLAVSDDPVDALDALDAGQLKELDQALAAEFNSKGRG